MLLQSSTPDSGTVKEALESFENKLNSQSRMLRTQRHRLQLALDTVHKDEEMDHNLARLILDSLLRYGIILNYGTLEIYHKSLVMLFLEFIQKLKLSPAFVNQVIREIHSEPLENKHFQFKKTAKNSTFDETRSNSFCMQGLALATQNMDKLEFSGNFYYEKLVKSFEIFGISKNQLAKYISDHNIDSFQRTRSHFQHRPNSERETLAASHFFFPLDEENKMIWVPKHETVRHPIDWIVRRRNHIGHGTDLLDSMSIDRTIFTPPSDDEIFESSLLNGAYDMQANKDVSDYVENLILSLNDLILTSVSFGDWVDQRHQKLWHSIYAGTLNLI